MHGVAERDPKRPLDSIEAALLSLEAIRHVVRDALDQQTPGEADARMLLGELEETCRAWAGASWPHPWHERSLPPAHPRERRPVAPSRRLLLVARLVAILRRGWTPEGIIAWFQRPRPELNGRGVLDAIDDAVLEREILDLAQHGRAQHGS